MKILPITSNQKQQGFGIKGVHFNFDEKLLEGVFPNVERTRVTGLENIKPRTGEDILVDVFYQRGEGEAEKNKITLTFTEAQNALSNQLPQKALPLPKEEVILHSAWGKLNERSFKEILIKLAKKITHFRNSSVALQSQFS